MVMGWHPCGSSGVLRLLPEPVPGSPVTGTPDGKVVRIDAAAAAEALELIQKDGFSPGTAGPLDVTDEDSACAWAALLVQPALLQSAASGRGGRGTVVDLQRHPVIGNSDCRGDLPQPGGPADQYQTSASAPGSRQTGRDALRARSWPAPTPAEPSAGSCPTTWPGSSATSAGTPRHRPDPIRRAAERMRLTPMPAGADGEHRCSCGPCVRASAAVVRTRTLAAPGTARPVRARPSGPA
jgi:hypothetical protein